jgi:hypothetical protein
MAGDADNILDELIARVRRVRFWLVALGALKTGAIGLTCVSLYIGLYAWIDHHAHFGHLGRLSALVVLIVLLAVLAGVLARALRRTMTYAHAANHVESRHSFDQQLVAAVEYFERRDDYPYSRALARQLVRQVDRATQGFRLDSTVEKWRAYALGAFIVLGLSIVGLFVRQNVAYFSAYLGRLFRPMAPVAALVPPAAEPNTAMAPAKGARQPPAIQSMTARVSPPAGANGEQAAARLEPVKEASLEVLPHSLVELRVETTAPLREATMLRARKPPVTQTLSDANAFTVRFRADAAEAVAFELVGADGTASLGPLQLRVQLKADGAPQFKLLSPDGDCLASDVASIPIAFEVTDDFGLDRAQLYCEFPGGDRILLDSNEPRGAARATLRHTLELEQHDLRVGDSILFYAQARDIDTGQTKADVNSCSDVYFIEIRPYRQYWHPQPGSDKPGPPGPVPEDLVTVLEYTRAIVKKTWTLAHERTDITQNASRCDAIRNDVEYCARKLADMRDDPNNGFSDAEKAALSQVGRRYDQAGDGLRRHDAQTALTPATEAYRLLRQFIDERHLNWTPPPNSPSVPQDMPERVRLQEQPQDPQADAQRAENQLQKLQRKIESLAQEQKSLSSDLKNALGQGQAAENGQPGDSSSAGAGGPQNSRSSHARSGSSRGDGPASTSTDARLRMLEAKQKALRAQASQAQAELEQLYTAEASAQGRARDEARQHLEQAVKDMEQSEAKLSDARYESAAPGREQADPSAPADSASRQLAEAGRAIKQGLSAGKPKTAAEQAQEMAEQLAEDAEVLDESLSPEDRQRMLDRLEAAKRLLQSRADPQWANVTDSGAASGGLVYTKEGPMSTAETARMLARQFWSMAIETRTRQVQPVVQEPSDVRFFQAEKEFFEKAARFNGPNGEK